MRSSERPGTTPFSSVALRAAAEVELRIPTPGCFPQSRVVNPLVWDGAPGGRWACAAAPGTVDPIRPGIEGCLSIPEQLVVNEMRVVLSD